MSTLAEQIQAMEFDHVFTLHPDGTITEPTGIYAPEVVNDGSPGGDIYIADAGGRWGAMTGLTGQDRYYGAVMHPSEYVGRGVADAMQEMAQDEPVAFALVVVTDLDVEEGEDDACGWAIVYRRDVSA